MKSKIPDFNTELFDQKSFITQTLIQMLYIYCSSYRLKVNFRSKSNIYIFICTSCHKVLIR